MEIQRTIGADIIMAFDECTPYPCDYNYAKRSMKMTHRWLDRCINPWILYPLNTGTSKLFPIVQGSTYKDLRTISRIYCQFQPTRKCHRRFICREPAEKCNAAMTEVVCEILPEDKPRYLMGVGTPINILENIALGIA
jgi:queuine tRNA-ribosyltransferase